MNTHKHARLTPHGRALLVQRVTGGLRVEEAAQAAGVSVRTAYKWLKRLREEGLHERSSRPPITVLTQRRPSTARRSSNGARPP